MDFQREFPDNEACLDYLFASLYPGAVCPKCGDSRYYLQQGTSHYVCICGGHQISPKKGTIFHKSRTDLVKWFYAIYLFSISKNGVSANELQRQLGVTYKTAWRMGFQIRKLMEQPLKKFGGVIEADETYIGGKRRIVRGRGALGKTPVFGLQNRQKAVYTVVVPNVRANTLLGIIDERVKRKSTLMTDKFASYRRVAEHGYIHETVDHGAHEYVRGNVHTNSIEGFWGQLKRSLDGTYHQVSPRHLQKYLDEHAWRWNRRHASSHPFRALLKEATS